MSNKEALTTVLKMADNLYNKDILNHILHNDLEITNHQKEALDHVGDYILDLEKHDNRTEEIDDVVKWMDTLGLDSDLKKKED